MKGLVFVIEKTRVRLKIVGSEFVVSADEDKDYIVKISNMVDEKIKELLRQGDSMNVAMAAILAALNYCDELEKEKIITEELLKRTETSETIASKVSSELEYLRTENKRLKEEKLGLHKVIDELKGVADSGEIKVQSEEFEESPQQLRIPLPNDEEIKQAEVSETPAQPSPKAVEEEAVTEHLEEKAEVAQSKPKQEEAKPQPAQPQAPTAPLTARQMLEEKRKALLAQKGVSNGAVNRDRPKPFRPVTSAKSGGGAFKGNGKSEPKINYRDNDKISDSYRRSDFADIPAEEDTLSFFDHR